MRQKLIQLASVAAAAALVAGGAHAGLGPADFVYYTGYNDTGSGFDFSGQTIFATDSGVNGIQENRDLGGSDTAPNWPSAAVVFMADVTATFTAPTSSFYEFQIGSDDGGYAFIDGNLLLNDGGVHGIQYVTGSTFLTAGAHSVEIQYGNLFCCGAVLNFAQVPEPSSWAVMMLGVAGLGAALRTRRKSDLAEA